MKGTEDSKDDRNDDLAGEVDDEDDDNAFDEFDAFDAFDDNVLVDNVAASLAFFSAPSSFTLVILPSFT